MNGDSKELLTAFEKIGLERHKENLGKFDVITSAISSINTRCFDRTRDYVLMTKHIEQAEKKGFIKSDRMSRLLVGFALICTSALIGALTNVWMTKQ